MFRLPEGVTWTMVAVAAVVIIGGMWAAKGYTERQRLLGNLRAHAQAHPEDADIVGVLIDCNSRITVDLEGCSRKLIERVGADHVLERMGKLQVEGAFGKPLGPDGKPAP